jgi:hypothetical protein
MPLKSDIARRIGRLEAKAAAGTPAFVWISNKADVCRLIEKAEAANPGRKILTLSWRPA